MEASREALPARCRGPLPMHSASGAGARCPAMTRHPCRRGGRPWTTRLGHSLCRISDHKLCREWSVTARMLETGLRYMSTRHEIKSHHLLGDEGVQIQKVRS